MDKRKIERHTGKPFKEESISISQKTFSLKVNTITGKEGEYWVVISPSLQVSGYGKTREEAVESFDENIYLFLEDIRELSFQRRVNELKKLGWIQSRFFKKRLSKVFVDENGALQNLEHAQLNSLESVV